jgi:CRP-like cAMP-binding protein
MENTTLLQKYGQTLEPGQVVFSENEDGEQMYIIQEGQVQISRKIAGRETPIAVLEKGDFFGEMAIVNRIKRTASAKALTRSVLLGFDRVGLEQMVEKNPKIALNIIDKLCRRLQNSNLQVQQLAQKSQKRMILTAVEILMRTQENLGLSEALVDELAISLDISRAEVELVFKDLLQAGALENRGGAWVVRDREAFQKFAEKA